MKKTKSVRRQRTKEGEIPQIKHRKDRNLAYVYIDGIKRYLGPYDGGAIPPAIEAERMRIWNEYQATHGLNSREIEGKSFTIAQLLNRFLDDAKTTYVKNGRSTGSYERFVFVLNPVFVMYGDHAVEDFTPKCVNGSLKVQRTEE